MASWDKINPQTYGERTRFEDVFELFDIKAANNKWRKGRPIGPITSVYQYWFTIATKNGKTDICKTSLSYNPETEGFDDDIPDPYRELAEKHGIRGTRTYITNVIDRKAQENRPRKVPPPTKKEVKTGFKDKDSDTWTPARVFVMASSVTLKVKNLMELNDGKPPSNPKAGFDINVKYDKDGTGTAKYDVQMDNKGPLTAEERELLLWDLSQVSRVIDSLADAKREAESIEKKLILKDGKKRDDSMDDLEDDDAPPKAKKKSKKVVDDDDDEDVPVRKGKRRPVDDDDDDDDPAPVRKKGRVVDDLDDLELDDDDDPAPPKKKGKKVVDDDDDLDLDLDLDDDDDDDPKPVKKKKKMRK